MTEPRDPILDVLLGLDGQVLVVDPEGGHWVRFVVTRVPIRRRSRTASTTRSRCTDRMASGWSDSIMPIRSRAEARRASGPSASAADIRAYEYRDAATLLADFWATVDAVLRERGVIQ